MINQTTTWTCPFGHNKTMVLLGGKIFCHTCYDQYSVKKCTRVVWVLKEEAILKSDLRKHWNSLWNDVETGFTDFPKSDVGALRLGAKMALREIEKFIGNRPLVSDKKEEKVK